MKRSLGKMSKRTRSLGASKKILTVSHLVQKYKVGERVILDLQSRYEGMPHPRHRGKIGTIIGLRGNAYEVEVQIGNSKKMLVVSSMHLKRKS